MKKYSSQRKSMSTDTSELSLTAVMMKQLRSVFVCGYRVLVGRVLSWCLWKHRPNMLYFIEYGCFLFYFQPDCIGILM